MRPSSDWRFANRAHFMQQMCIQRGALCVIYDLHVQDQYGYGFKRGIMSE